MRYTNNGENMETKLPNKPGVYLFKSTDNSVLYIGKATSLHTRVQSYFCNKHKDPKIDALIEEHSTIEHIVTNSELEASLLEAHLIKLYQPKFNILLKSGQPFLYLLITKKEIPAFTIVRNKKEKGIYFGPFLYKKPVRAAYEYLIKTFRLKLCNKKIDHGCLDFHIGTCAGSCRPDFDLQGYKIRLQLAIDALTKDQENFKKIIKENITLYSDQQEYEKAQELLEYLNHIDSIFQTLHIKFSPKKYAAQLSAATIPGIISYDSKTELILQNFFGTNKKIETIDCFDISHFQSTCIVGSCIRFSFGIPDPHNFRHFNIKNLTQQDDYAALAQIVERRYKNPKDLPDLILIDGGKGQLHSVQNILKDSSCISLAKKEELLFWRQIS